MLCDHVGATRKRWADTRVTSARGDALQAAMTVLGRAITYGKLFIGFALVFLRHKLSGAGVTRRTAFGATQLAGMIIVAAGDLILAPITTKGTYTNSGSMAQVTLSVATSRLPLHAG